jgi:threonylcarbamoyladenosine tRNA methylthiotransferase MtaB
MTFGADIIAGFPTETEEMFAHTLALVEDCGLTWLHVFPYSPRKGTPAARMPQLPGAAIRERAALLRAAGVAAVERHLLGQVGHDHLVLMESARMGRTAQFAEVVADRDLTDGQIVPLRITGVRDGQLLATSG